jgi:hypothetical protein
VWEAGPTVDRRAIFFALSALLCAGLVPVAGTHARVAGVIGVVYLVLAAASWADHRSRHHV